jgi:Tol biopolymer transport system component
MSRGRVLAAIVASALCLTASRAAAQSPPTAPATTADARPMFYDPAISPDRSEIAFVSGRDIWTVPAAGGEARLLVSHAATETRPLYSPDGRWQYFTSSRGDIQGMNDVWRVSSEGGTPMVVAADRYSNEFWSAPSPDGQTLAITARSTMTGQWWRRGHSHLDEAEIWLVRDLDRPHVWIRAASGDIRQLTRFTSGWVLWPSISATTSGS